jgi:diguanylate cyclase (GGDEF)-like protein
MSALQPIRRALADPRELERGVLMRRVGITLNFAGCLYALCYAALFAATPAGADRIAVCGVALGAVSMALWLLPPKGEYATISALIATAIIGVILTTPDVTATVPLFYLWPLTALAYFHSPKFLAGSVVWMALTLAPALLVDGTDESRTVYLGAVSTSTLMAVLVAIMRRDEHRLRRSLLQGSSTDSLTGLLNRRAFVPEYAAALAAAREQGDGISVVLIDLDHFKRFNDTHGHLAGDAALRRVAAVLQAATEPGDVIARLGGEEFALILPGRGAAAAQRTCDRIAATLGPSAPAAVEHPLDRATIRAGLRAQLANVLPADDTAPVAPPAAPQPARHLAPDAPVPPLTASYGIVQISPRDDLDGDTILGRADEALYAAKRSGRDRVAIWADGRTILGPPIHVAGLLALGTVEPIDAPNVPRRREPDPETLVDHRAKLLFRAASAMFVVGGLNALAGGILLGMTGQAAAWQWGIGASLIGIGVLLAIVRGSLRYAGGIGFVGIGAVSGVVATVDPLSSAPLFYAWPIAMVAYFARPKLVGWAIGWTGLTLAGAMFASTQPVDEPGLVLGTMLNIAMLAALITALRWREDRLSEGLVRAAAIDPLTGALTRRAFLPAVDGWLRDTTARVSLLLVDIDHFKRYNDEHGHLAGDDALRRAARALQAGVPEGALICRFGGEEFAIAIPGGGMRLARDCADQIAEELAALPPGDLTISAGIAVAHADEFVLDRVIARADQGLYAAKGAGRARVAWFAQDADEQLVVSEPIHVARPAAFHVLDGDRADRPEDTGRGLSSAA